MSNYNTLPLYSLKVVRERGIKYPVSTCPNQLAALRILQSFLWEKDCEHLMVIMLDRHHNFLGMTEAAKGGIHGLHVGVRDVFKSALLHRAAAIIISHNHPSGDTYPSPEDLAFTRQCVKAGKILGCPVLDHIIVSSGVQEGSYSFQEHGRLQETEF